MRLSKVISTRFSASRLFSTTQLGQVSSSQRGASSSKSQESETAQKPGPKKEVPSEKLEGGDNTASEVNKQINEVDSASIKQK